MSKPDYQANDPKGWCGDAKRGAALGRPAIHDPDFKGHLHVQEIPLEDGYDENGTYFGEGRPLYWVANHLYTIDYMIRADDHADVLKQVKEKCPKVKGITVISPPTLRFVQESAS